MRWCSILNEVFDSREQIVGSPFGVDQLLGETKRILAFAYDVRNMTGFPKELVEKCMHVLSKKIYKGCSMGRGDTNDFNVCLDGTINEKDWTAAVGQLPKSITLHIPLSASTVSDDTMKELANVVSGAFPNAKVDTNRDLRDDTSQPLKRLLWACDLAKQLTIRFLLGGEKSESHTTRSGNLGES